MKQTRNQYRVLIIGVLLALGSIISIVYAVAISKVQRAYQEHMRNSIIEVKKNFLKDTVSNVVWEIKNKQVKQTELYRNEAASIEHALRLFAPLTKELFLQSSIDLLEKNEDFSALILDRQSGKIIYSSLSAKDAGGCLNVGAVETLRGAHPVFATLEAKDYEVIYFVSQGIIDARVKSQIHEELHSYKFSNNAYIWVNEVLDYNGGDRYAIRRIHPNLKETEEMYLSTSMTDIAGNYPYLTELEGVKRDGELFFNYFFEKNQSDAISEKITYAVLFQEYDWIIAMGVHLDDVKALVDHTIVQSTHNTQGIMLTVAGTTLLLIGVTLIFVSLLERWYYQKSTEELSDEIYKDALTMAYNRRGAERHLEAVFANYRLTKQNVTLIMLDIDDYKQVNDLCGHDKGDLVLKKMAETITSHIRSTDFLCRWGGDEFLIICEGLKEENIAPFAEKLLGVVSALEFDCGVDERKRSITISMGISNFVPTDDHYHSSIKRADQALYCSKAQGKNQASVNLSDLEA